MIVYDLCVSGILVLGLGVVIGIAIFVFVYEVFSLVNKGCVFCKHDTPKKSVGEGSVNEFCLF